MTKRKSTANGFKRLKQEGLVAQFVVAVSLLVGVGFVLGFLAALFLT